jgi:CubicO group peptidase (beta-lactamase class C family)
VIHDEIAAVLKRLVVASGAAPGASAYVAHFADGAWVGASAAAGARSSDDGAAVTPETIYDLASLTKPLVAAAAARLVRAGAVDWNTPRAALLPELARSASADTPLELFAAHRAGLVAHFRVREEDGPRSAWLLRCAEALRPECRGTPPPGGFAPIYSDVGYILLGAALEAAARCPLATLVAREVAAAASSDLAAAEDWKARIGSAEFAQRVAPTEPVAERGGLISGIVHDDNAWDLAGESMAGHAGLFGTAQGVGRFGQLMLDALGNRASGWLSPAEAEVLVRPRPGGSLRAGFDGKSEEGSAAGSRFGPKTFGHLGFTGTSIWCDPDARIVAVLLTNRVYPTRENIRIREVRPLVHGELFGLAAGLRGCQHG